MHWQFWIDVGGTFTDCVARSPSGALKTVKVLSSGATKGTISARSAEHGLIDPARRHDPAGFWTGYRCHLLNDAGDRVASSVVQGFDAARASLRLREPHRFSLPDGASLVGCAYELESGEEAPLLAIRQVLDLGLEAEIPSCEVRLGTTRGTNALLQRRGARTGFVTTAGFADCLQIGNQDRPRLFDLNIRKPQPLYEVAIEAAERIAADGSVLQPLQLDSLRVQLRALRESGIESLAVCLLHSWTNPEHERLIERIAREAGFEEVSCSHAVAPRIKLVPRAETTVLDAYLNPVLREYIGRIQAPLTAGEVSSSLRVMTSVGGLVRADHFTGKDCLLSGPAGGVIGFSRVAERAGFPRAIGFDMGGTSTDVSRYDGRYELEYETVKAGVRIASPLLAIETVAAGGGSLCGFDGVQLFVGPQSAGADPGPACYGRGGPLTVTDVNLFLGRLREDSLPFPLARKPVELALSRLCDEIAASPLGRRYSPMELAEGFVAVANTTMSRAIRKISIARGYHPADYALVTFGGAGGQHACAIAESLGMRTVLAHPLAGVLSAWGIGMADVRRHAEQTVLQPYSPQVIVELEEVFTAMEQSLYDQIQAEGIAPSQIDPPTRSLDLRYLGVGTTITIEAPHEGDYASAYEDRHQQIYGYCHRGRIIEIAVARVALVGRTPEPASEELPVAERRPTAAETVQFWFQGQLVTAARFQRQELQSGDRLSGPAIVSEPTSTLVIDPGWNAIVMARGELLLQQENQRDEETHAHQDDASAVASHPLVAAVPGDVESHSSTNDGDADPIRLEIANQQFASIAEQMGLTLQRTAISTNVKERLDFSCAIFDPEGRLVVNAPHIPVHLGAMSETAQAVLRDNPDLQPGDVVVTNDPYRGGSHLPDITVVTPVHDPQGRLLFWTASRAHHAEIGGIVPGSMPPFSRNLAEEGVLIRNFRLISAGSSREEALRALLENALYPSRKVDDNLADIAAQAAANRLGSMLLRSLVASLGIQTVQSSMVQIQRAAAEKMRRALRKLGDGQWTFTDRLDDGSPIAARVTIEGGTASVDFTGTGPVLASNLNANRAIVTAAVMYVFRCLIAEDIPLNSGVLDPVSILLPESLLCPPAADDPRNCPAIVGGNVETSQRVVDVLLGALGQAAASQGTMNNLTFGDGTFGYYETICGGSGATVGADGADAVHTHMTNTRLTDVEVLEHRYPVRVQEFAIRRGSGGRGRRRGGDGIRRRIEFLRTLHVSMLSQRRPPYRPFGLAGGEPGSSGRNRLLPSGQQPPRELDGSFQREVHAGEVLVIETPGGGGFGAASPVD